MGTTLDGLKKLYKKMSGTKSKATTTAEALDEIAASYTKSDIGVNGVTVLAGRISNTSDFVKPSNNTYTTNIELDEINQLYVRAGKGTTANVLFTASGSSTSKTATFWMPVVKNDSGNEVVIWVLYKATMTITLDDEGNSEVTTVFTPSGTVPSGATLVDMKFSNLLMNRTDVSQVIL